MRNHHALILMCALLHCGTAAAADPITLVCTGTTSHWGLDGPLIVDQPVRESLIIDLDKSAVRGSMGSFTVIRVSESRVVFQGPYQKTQVIMSGGIDRISGEASLNVTRDGGSKLVVQYLLSCKPASPMF